LRVAGSPCWIYHLWNDSKFSRIPNTLTIWRLGFQTMYKIKKDINLMFFWVYNLSYSFAILKAVNIKDINLKIIDLWLYTFNKLNIIQIWWSVKFHRGILKYNYVHDHQWYNCRKLKKLSVRKQPLKKCGPFFRHFFVSIVIFNFYVVEMKFWRCRNEILTMKSDSQNLRIPSFVEIFHVLVC